MNTDLVSSSSSVFDFCAEHNGVQCIESLKPEDRGNACQYWFTAKMLAKNFDCSEDTIRRRIDILVQTGDIVEPQICVSTKIPDSLGRMIQETVIYNLTVFNKLGMTFLDNPKAVEIRAKFNDIIVKEETKRFPIPETFEDALILAGQQMKIAKEEERKRIQAEKERDDANKKTETADKRAYSAMGTASAKSKENTKLKAENEDLKIKLQESTTYLCVKAIPWFSKYFIIPKEKENDSVYSVVGKKLTALSKKLNYEVKSIPTPQYPIGAYHTDVIEIFRKQLDNDSLILAKYRK